LTAPQCQAPHIDLEGGPLALDERTVFARFARRWPLRGRRVVEVGGRLDAALAESEGVAAWFAVDPRNPPGAVGPVVSIQGSATDLPLPDASIDLVFSSDALQHVHELGGLFGELDRVLKPGGAVYCNFGPVWSAPDGAHVEGLTCDGGRWDFWDGALLPAWAHLVLDPPELSSILTMIHGSRVGAAMSEWVLHSSWINRRPLHEILELATTSPLRVVSVRGCREFGYEFVPPRVDHPLTARLGRIQVERSAWRRHGIPAEHLDVRDVELVLEARRRSI